MQNDPNQPFWKPYAISSGFITSVAASLIAMFYFAGYRVISKTESITNEQEGVAQTLNADKLAPKNYLELQIWFHQEYGYAHSKPRIEFSEYQDSKKCFVSQIDEPIHIKTLLMHFYADPDAPKFLQIKVYNYNFNLMDFQIAAYREAIHAVAESGFTNINYTGQLPVKANYEVIASKSVSHTTTDTKEITPLTYRVEILLEEWNFINGQMIDLKQSLPAAYWNAAPNVTSAKRKTTNLNSPSQIATSQKPGTGFTMPAKIEALSVPR